MISRKDFYAFLFYTYLIWTFIRFAFVDVGKNTVWIVPYIKPFTYLLDPAFILLFIFIFILERRFHRSFGFLLYVSFILIALGILSFVGNMDLSSPSTAIKFFIGYFRFIPFFLFSSTLTNYIKTESLIKNIIKISVIMLLISSFINVLWFLKVPILRNDRAFSEGNPDWAYGLQENTNIFAMSLVVLFVYLLHKFLSNKNFLSPSMLKYLLLILFALLQLAWSESKVNIIGIIISFVLAYILTYGLKLNLKILVIPVLMFFITFYFLKNTYSNLSHVQAAANNTGFVTMIIKKSIERNYKLNFIRDIVQKVPNEIRYPVVGAGPGVLASKFALDHPSKLSSKYFVKYDRLNLQNAGNSVLNSPRTGYTAIYGDLGPIAFLLYFFLYIYMGYKISRFARRNKIFEGPAIIWSALTINFLFNQIFFDSLYIGAPVFIIWTLGPLLLIADDADRNNVLTSNL